MKRGVAFVDGQNLVHGTRPASDRALASDLPAARIGVDAGSLLHGRPRTRSRSVPRPEGVQAAKGIAVTASGPPGTSPIRLAAGPWVECRPAARLGPRASAREASARSPLDFDSPTSAPRAVRGDGRRRVGLRSGSPSRGSQGQGRAIETSSPFVFCQMFVFPSNTNPCRKIEAGIGRFAGSGVGTKNVPLAGTGPWTRRAGAPI